MHWFSFVLGALAGWLVEWLIDLFYWRRRWNACREEEARLREELANVKKDLAWLRAGSAEVDQLRADLAARQQKIDALQFELSAARSELSLARSSASHIEAPSFEAPSFGAPAIDVPDVAATIEPALEIPEVTFPAERTGGIDLWGADTGVAGPGAAARSALPDDLKLIEGIGPAIARVLNEQGIHTFADLAGASLETLERILAGAGPRFRIADPRSWAGQAALAARGDWDGLKAMQDLLKGGR